MAWEESSLLVAGVVADHLANRSNQMRCDKLEISTHLLQAKIQWFIQIQVSSKPN